MVLLAYAGSMFIARHLPRNANHDFYTGLYVSPKSRSREHVIPVSVLRAHRFRKSAFAEDNTRMVDISVNWFRSNHRFARLPFDHDKYMTRETKDDVPAACYRISSADLKWLRKNAGLDAFVICTKEQDEYDAKGVRIAAFRNTRNGLFFPLCDTKPIFDLVNILSTKMYPTSESMRKRLLIDVLHPSFWQGADLPPPS
jgi:hypothetical protein